METTRVDRWLWAVRIFKTRSAASEACRAGHVRINDTRVKPAAPVRIGDTIRVRTDRERILEVARIIETRVGAPIAAECLIDHSPAPPPREELAGIALRPRGAGRPSKRDRRQLDRSRGARPAR